MLDLRALPNRSASDFLLIVTRKEIKMSILAILGIVLIVPIVVAVLYAD